jgi:hypothetical protein
MSARKYYGAKLPRESQVYAIRSTTWRVDVGEMTPADIARRVGVSGMRVRGLLRQMYPKEAPGVGVPWDLSPGQVDEVLAYFQGVRTGAPRTTGPSLTSRDAGPPEVPAEWFWEGHVQDRVVAHLMGQGWLIMSTADTASRSTGPDIEARKANLRLMVEVKGYPSVGYRDPRRASEVKRTNPTLQAKHWFADALLKVVRHRGTHPRDLVATAFPKFARYESLLAESFDSLDRLGVGVFLVPEAGPVLELTVPSIPQVTWTRVPKE